MSNFTKRNTNVDMEAGIAGVRTRAYYSTYHLWAADHFKELSREAEKIEIEQKSFSLKNRSYVTNAVLSAVAFLEAAINELYQDIAEKKEGYLSDKDIDNKKLMSDFWNCNEKVSVLDKYQKALTFLEIPQFNTGHTPYQEVSLVIQLRNELVHYKPQWTGHKSKHRLTNKLYDKFAGNQFLEGKGNPWFPAKCMGYGCAKWATESVRKFADDFFKKIDVTPNYQNVFTDRPAL